MRRLVEFPSDTGEPILVEVEDDTTRAEYRYDYADRRISKRVWPKSDQGPSGLLPSLAINYPTRDFEVRDHEQPTKYVRACGRP